MPLVNRRKEIKIRAETNDMETKKKTKNKRLTKPRDGFLKR